MASYPQAFEKAKHCGHVTKIISAQNLMQLDPLSWCHGENRPAHSDRHYTSLQEWALNDPTGQVIDEQKLNKCCKCITWIPKKILGSMTNPQQPMSTRWPLTSSNPIIFLQTCLSLRTGQYWHDCRSPGSLRPIRVCGFQTCRDNAKCSRELHFLASSCPGCL